MTMTTSTTDFLKELAAFSKACDTWAKATRTACVANPSLIKKFEDAHPEVFAAQSNPHAAIRDIAKFYVD